jgi:hypothetical protein
MTCFGFQPTWKRLMTTMQLVQFFVGLPVSSIYLFVPRCVNPPVRPFNPLAEFLGWDGYWTAVFAFSCTHVYVICLILLFLDFARRTYSAKRQSERPKVQ